jgi:hypothetical protein
MDSASRFRVAAIVVAVLTALYSSASLFSEVFSLPAPRLPADPSKIVSRPINSTARWAATISPFRSDLDANYALTEALMTLRPENAVLSAEQVQKNGDSQESVTRVLKAAPYNSALWLVLALLRAQQRNLGGRPLVEALKMSYFTAPNDAQMMPLRLYAATHTDALADSDLQELARGDVRLMLTRQSDLKTSVLSAYRAGSSLGKKFIEDAAQSIDPEFASLLRK